MKCKENNLIGIYLESLCIKLMSVVPSDFPTKSGFPGGNDGVCCSYNIFLSFVCCYNMCLGLTLLVIMFLFVSSRVFGALSHQVFVVLMQSLLLSS